MKIAYSCIVAFFLLFSGFTADSQIISYTTDPAGALNSVAANATGGALSRVNGAASPATPCGTGFSATGFTAVTTYATTLPAVEATASPNTGYMLNVTGFTVALRRSTTGPASARLAYSTDGGTTWTNQGLDQSPNNAACGTTTTATWTTTTSVSYPGTIKFRVYGFNASSTTGTIQIMNLAINGTVSAVSPGCGTPAGLASSAITTTSALVSWTAVTGATSYSIRYRQVGTTTWSTTTSGTTSVTLSGLLAGTNYEFQVAAVCGTTTGSYTGSSLFTTVSVSCGTPSGLSATAITTSSALLSWGAVTGATNYSVRYRVSGTTTWTTTVSGTTSLSITGLAAGTIYEYEVAAICGTTTGSYTTSGFFTTLTTTTSGSTGKINIYFNTPVDNSVSMAVNAVYLNSCMADTLVAYINRAKYTIDIAQYDYNQSTGFANIATAINNAYLLGKKIRWIYDGSQPNTGLASLNPGIHTLASPTSGAYGIMHNKFVIIDAKSTNPADAIVCTGSEDWGVTQFNHNANNILFIQDSALAHAYSNEFNMMWGDTGIAPNATLAKFGPFKTDLGAHIFNIGGKTVELYFSPSDHTDTHIQSTINSANTDLYFGVYDFTESTDATDIVSRHTSGVYTAGIVDQYSNTGAAYPILTSGLGSLMKTYTSSSYIYHNKMLIVDQGHSCSDPLVLTGSHNWTVSANTKNDENILIIHSDTISNIYYQSFYANYAALGGTLTATTPCTATTCGTPTGLSASAITTTTAVLTWTAVSGATGYTIQYRPTGTTTWSTTTSGTTSVSLTGLTPATTYEFQVSATCSSGTSGFSSSTDFTTLALACTVPAGLTATGVTATSATLNWIAVSGAISYNIQYRITGTGTWSSTTSPTNSVTISGLTPGSTYEFEVQTVCSTSTTAWSGSTTFATPSITCPLPSGLSVTAITTSSATVSWGAVTGATGYTLEYRVAGTTAWTYVTTASTSATLTGLLPATAYQYGVQTTCSVSDSSGYTTSPAFTTLGISTTVAANVAATNHFDIYPNPVGQSSTISYHVDIAAKVSVKVYNVMGQEVSVINDLQTQEAGDYSYDLPISNPGIYFVRLNIDNASYVKRVVKL